MSSELTASKRLPTIDPSSAGEAEVFVMPCSVSQKRFWLLEQISPGNTALNIPIALKLSGSLEIDILARALNAMVARHEILRTHFAQVEGEPKQIISPEVSIKLHRIDLGNLPEEQHAERIRGEMDEEVKKPLPLAEAPLLRATLVRLSVSESVLMLTAHHIISDGWSNGILVRELGAFYDAFLNGRKPDLPPLAIQYADYVLWQEEWLKTPQFQKQLGYWDEALAGELPVLDFPTDFPRSTGSTRPTGSAGQSHTAILESLLLPLSVSDALKRFCVEEGVTLFMIFYSAYIALLHRYTGRTNFMVGTTAANRNQPDLENLIGLFANILILRSDVSGKMTFREFLVRQRDASLSTFANHEAPFESVLERLQQRKNGVPKTLLQTHFLYQRAFMQPIAIGDLAIRPLYSISPGSTFELTFGIVERAEGIRLQMEYHTQLYRASTIRRLLLHFQALLEAVIARPETSIEDLPIFAANEREELESTLPSKAAPKAEPRPVFDPSALMAELDRQLEQHFKKSGAPFMPTVGLPAGAVLIALDDQRRLLPKGIPGDVYLAHGFADLGNSPSGELVSGPSDAATLLPLLKTGFIGRNAEEGGVELWGRAEDIVCLPTFRVNRRAAELQRNLLPSPSASKKIVSDDSSLAGALHQQLIEVWREVLKISDFTIHDNFFDLGGTSFLALRMMLQAGKLCGRPLPLSLLLTGATVANLARYIIEANNANNAATPLIPLQPKGSRAPLFFLHGDWMGGGFYCQRLSRQLGEDQPFYVLPPNLTSFRLEEMAAYHLAAVRKQSPHGPYILSGYCIGALIAMEMARQLVAEGETVAHLFLIDPPLWSVGWLRGLWPWVDRIGNARKWNLERKIDFFDRYGVSTNRWLKRPWRSKVKSLLHRFGRSENGSASDLFATDSIEEQEVIGGLDDSAYYLAYRLYRIKPLEVPATFLFPESTPLERLSNLAHASKMDPAQYQVEILPGTHTTCVTTHLPALAKKLEKGLGEISAEGR